MPRFVLCRFVKDVDGKLGQSYTFSDSDNHYGEIQENTNVIFFDLDDSDIAKKYFTEPGMIFWGSGKVSNVEFNQNTGSNLAGISNLSGYGITEASGISTLTINAGILSDPLLKPDISAEDLARASGTSLDELRQEADRGNSIATMAEGAAKIVTQLCEPRQ